MRIIDLHEDFGITSSTENTFTETKQSSIEILKKYGDVIIFSAIYPFHRVWSKNIDKVMLGEEHIDYTWVPDQLGIMHQVNFYSTLRHKGIVDFVRRKTDIREEGTKFLISMEGADTIAEPTDIYSLYDLGVRCIGFTWNYDNKYAASCYSKKDYGLTGAGEELVDLCNELGIIVDTAHTSRQTTLEICKYSKKPVIMSHSNVKSLHDHPRNADDEMIEAIHSKHGVLGVSGIAEMLSSDPTLNDLVKNVNYIGENFGWDMVAIGSDFLGMRGGTKCFTSFQDISRLGELIEQKDQLLHANVERVIRAVLK
jgi:membrane dipeptidase